MKITGEIKSAPHDGSVIPALMFEFEIEYPESREAILSLRGFLKSEDGKILAEVCEVPKDQTKPVPLGEMGATVLGMESKSAKYMARVSTFLSRAVLEHIENRRLANPKRDVWLSLHLRIVYAFSCTGVAYLRYIDPSPRTKEVIPGLKGQEKLVVWRHGEYPRDYSPTLTGEWVLSGESGPVFLQLKEESIEARVRIPAADWIHDFAPKLGLGEYFVVEVPRGGVIKEAWDYIAKAEECYRNWESKGAYANCREAGSLLDKTIEEKFGKDSLVYKERWRRFYSLFNNYASLDLHVEDISRRCAPDEKIEIGKGDVESLLIMTKALVKYVGSLLSSRGRG